MTRLRGLASGIAVAILAFAVIAGVVTAIRHIPHPAKKIEWVHSDESVIVQMTTVENANDELSLRLTVPEFTLYGDGTLLFTVSSERKTNQVFKARLPNGTIGSLLTAAEDKRIMDFSYEQPELDVAGLSTTYFYFNAKSQSNAVSAYGIASDSPLVGDAWKNLRILQSLRERLLHVASEAKSRSEPYTATEVLQLWRREGEEELHEQVHTGDDAARLNGVFAIGKGSGYETVPAGGDGRLVEGGYRPILPHEENFPEFEPPQ